MVIQSSMGILWDIMRYMIVFHGPIIVSYRIHEKKSLKGDREERPEWCSLGPVESGEWSFLPNQVLDVAAVKIPGQREPCCCNSTGDCRALWGTSLYVEPKSKHVAQGCRQRRRYRGKVWIFELCMPMAAGLCHAWVLLVAADNVWWPMPIGL